MPDASNATFHRKTLTYSQTAFIRLYELRFQRWVIAGILDYGTLACEARRKND